MQRQIHGFKRQSVNEREWRVKNDQVSDPAYHRIRRRQRRHFLAKIIQHLLECIEVGGRFLNRAFNTQDLKDILDDFISGLGVRRANKLWHFKIDSDLYELAVLPEPKIIQTSRSR